MLLIQIAQWGERLTCRSTQGRKRDQCFSGQLVCPLCRRRCQSWNQLLFEVSLLNICLLLLMCWWRMFSQYDVVIKQHCHMMWMW